MTLNAHCIPDRLAAEAAAEKAARGQVEQTCAQLGMQLLDLQRQLKASQTREAAATLELADSMEKVSVLEGCTSWQEAVHHLQLCQGFHSVT